MSLLERAIAIAVEAHAGQVDKAGAPYILHPLRVMLGVAPEHREAAVLHDVLEDCPAWPLQRLRLEGFSEEVLDALVALTRRKGESYEAFIDRLSANRMARAVKVADLRDNSDLSRIAAPTAKDHARCAKYERALLTLA